MMAHQHPAWRIAMIKARQNRLMARYAMPASRRPTFALLARNNIASARTYRLDPALADAMLARLQAEFA